MRKLCSNCYGHHIRKNCRSEKVTYETLVDHFRTTYKDIPEEFYGRFARPKQTQSAGSSSNPETKGSSSKGSTPQLQPSLLKPQPSLPQPKVPISETPAPPPKRITISLKRSEGDIWSSSQDQGQASVVQKSVAGPAPNLGTALQAESLSRVTPNVSLTAGGLADNVNYFLNGIRASFRNENVNVTSKQQQKKCPQTKNHDD